MTWWISCTNVPSVQPELAALKAVIAAAEAERTAKGLPDDLGWREFNDAVFPSFVKSDYAPHQVAFWEWLDTVNETDLPDPWVSIWPRGHAKSSSKEMAVAKLLLKKKRRYFLYVSGTQDMADKHVASVASLLEADEVEAHFGDAAEPAVNKIGTSKGWRRNRLTLKNGGIVDALGLDTSTRGVKFEDQRPDGIVLDDIDDEEDTARTIAKKKRRITQSILPAATDAPVVMMAQNIVSANSIAAQIADGRLEMLAGAHISGPLPAVEGMELELDEAGIWRIVAGEPTWQGMDLQACENRIRIYTRAAFILESQQEIDERDGALWTNALIGDHRISKAEAPKVYDRIILAIDPNQTGKHDDAGLVVVAMHTPVSSEFPHAYILEDGTELVGPSGWRDKAAELYLNAQCGAIVIERTGQGDTVEIFMREAPTLRGRPPQVIGVEATISKGDRARPVAELYRDGRVHHVGLHPEVERQQTTWIPGVSGESPGGLDALVHGVTHLLLDDKGGSALSGYWDMS